ncbi:MAG: DDE-type integrase/transposase/recombinase [Anaerolineales bacterium]|nr:DDE-type integrase/transposase/recombinase [Anaerolineales bacterium]
MPLRDGHWAYLVAFQDVFTRVIVGWALEDNMRSTLVIKALQKAIDRKPLPKGLIVHSDGGVNTLQRILDGYCKNINLSKV